MIVDLLTIKNKRVITNNDGSKQLDLSESVIDYRIDLIPLYPMVVTKEQAGKPWLISKAAYGTVNLFDLLMYFNGYSNPYSVDEGDKITIFDQQSMLKNVKDLTRIKDPKEKESDDNKKLPVMDQNRKKLLERLNRTITTATAPNVNDGAPQQEVSSGVITLGTDVSESRCKKGLTETQTRTEMIRKTVLNKIKNG